MSIIQLISGSSFMPLSVMAQREDFNKGSSEVESGEELLSECPDIIKIFADDTGVRRQNDFTSLLFTELILGIEFYLLKDSEEIAELNDDTYGTFYPTGTWSQGAGFSFAQSKYKGYKIEWSNVLALHGVGHYQIKVKFTFGESTVAEICGCNFLLQVYSHTKADKTFRIRTIQNGSILDGKDYLGMNWEQCWRLAGFFGYPQDKLEADNYLDSNRQLNQIQDTLYKEYTLQTDFLPKCYKSIFDNVLLSNQIFMDDYNLKNAYYPQLYDISVLPIDSSSNYFIESTDVYKEITFESRSRKTVKRNVK